MFLLSRNHRSLFFRDKAFHICKTFRYIARLVGPLAIGLSLALAAILLLFAVPPAKLRAAPPIAPFPDQTEALTQALKALVTQYQNDDGGYTRFSNGSNQDPSDADGTVDAILAIAGAGYNPNIPYPGEKLSPVQWIETHPISLANSAAKDSGAAAEVIMALVAANQNPRNYAGHNFVISLTNQLSSTGQFPSFDTYGHSLSILALKAVSEPIPITATQWLTSQQTITGSFPDNFCPDGLDQTGAAIMALLASGIPKNDVAIISATISLSNTQLPSGGWRPCWDEYNSANPNSTALIYQALLGLGEDMGGDPWNRGGGQTPLNALLEMQNTTGAFRFFGFDNFFSTIQAIPALANRVYPLLPKTLTEIVSPGSGDKTITYDDDPSGKSMQIEISDKAVTQATELRLEPITPLPTTAVPVTPTGTTFSFAGQLFTLKAFQGGVALPTFNFVRPVTLTLIYHDADIAALKEDSLQLYFWDGSAWQTDGITVVQRSPDQNKLVVTLSHLTDFALFGEIAPVYLPLIQKES